MGLEKRDYGPFTMGLIKSVFRIHVLCWADQSSKHGSSTAVSITWGSLKRRPGVPLKGLRVPLKGLRVPLKGLRVPVRGLRVPLGLL